MVRKWISYHLSYTASRVEMFILASAWDRQCAKGRMTHTQFSLVTRNRVKIRLLGQISGLLAYFKVML